MAYAEKILISIEHTTLLYCVGQHSQLGNIIDSLFEEDLGTNSVVCHQCRSSLLCLHSLKWQFDELKEALLAKLQVHKQPQTE